MSFYDIILSMKLARRFMIVMITPYRVVMLHTLEWFMMNLRQSYAGKYSKIKIKNKVEDV